MRINRDEESPLQMENEGQNGVQNVVIKGQGHRLGGNDKRKIPSSVSI
jgi:hypothetical protein